MPAPEVVILGSGNVATHLLKALCGAGVSCGLWSRNTLHACDMAHKAGLSAVTVYDSCTAIPADASFYIIAVSDRAVGEVTRTLGAVKGIVAHTSGSVPMCRNGVASGYGVFYPLQTFSADTPVDITKVPFFIEGSSAEVAENLSRLVKRIGATPYYADSAHRAELHLAAVFACNFANSMWAVSDRILEQGGYPLTVLEPLLHETLRKAMSVGPARAQTGPAARGDENVTSRQLARLTDPAERDVYADVTELIRQQQHNLKNLP